MVLTQLLASSPIPCVFRMSYLTNMYALIYRDVEQDVGLTRLEFVTLLCLASLGEATAQDIIGVTGWPKPSMSRAVRSLAERGLIKKRSDPSDVRRTLLRTTDDGMALYDQVSPAFVEREKKILSALSSKEATELLRLLTKLVNGTDQWAPQSR